MKKQIFVITLILLLLFVNVKSRDTVKDFFNTYIHKRADNVNKNTVVDDAKCTVKDVEEANLERLNRLLNKLTKQTFFKIFKVDLSSECPFWAMKQMCGLSGGCSVCECDSKDVPIPWKITTVNKVKKIIPGFKPTQKWIDDNKYVWFHRQAEDKMTYVNLLDNPEGNTGYKGEEASRVWRAIYNENCFKGKVEDMCLEQRVFYRLLSGLHQSITMHIAYHYHKQADEFNVNGGKPIFTPNYEMYEKVIAPYPERLKNLYFIFTFYLRAIQKSSKFLREYKYHTGNATEDAETRALMHELVNDNLICSPTFDESIMFRGAEKAFLREQIRNHFRNISMIMDCVACEKCKLWGKLQTLGLSVALKIVLSENTDECITTLQRNEIIAFINALRQLSESIVYLNKFNTMMNRKGFSLMYAYLMVGLFGLIVISVILKAIRKKQSKTKKVE